MLVRFAIMFSIIIELLRRIYMKKSIKYRKSVVSRYLVSDMKQEAFCKEEGISKGSLYLWRKKYGTACIESCIPSFIPISVDRSVEDLRIESMFKLRTLGGSELYFESGCKKEELKLLLELCDAST